MEEFPGFDVDGGAFVQEGKEGGHQKKCFFILREDESSDKLLAAKQARMYNSKGENGGRRKKLFYGK